MNEYLANIRFIKMYCWEKPLSKFIASTSESVADRQIIHRAEVTSQNLYGRVVHGSISCDPTQPNQIQLTMELTVW